MRNILVSFFLFKHSRKDWIFIEYQRKHQKHIYKKIASVFLIWKKENLKLRKIYSVKFIKIHTLKIRMLFHMKLMKWMLIPY